MTEPVNFAVSLARLEGKVDTLTVKVDAGDKASASLVELVKAEMVNLRKSFEDFRRDNSHELNTLDQGISKVRTDASKALADAEARVRIDIEGQQQMLDNHSVWLNRMIGGLIFVGALGVPGIVALVRGFTG